MSHPGPFKCPDCLIWWAGYEHRCQIDLTRAIGGGTTIPTWPTPIQVGTGESTVRCTCPPERGDSYAGTCLIHDVHTTYTVQA